MTSPRLLFILVSAVLALPATAGAQEYNFRSGGIAPPIPDGPMLQVPKDSRKPTWLEDGTEVMPAAATDAPRMLPTATGPQSALDRFGDGVTSASACQFDPCCQDGVFACGTMTTQILGGAYFSSKPGPRIPSFDYVPVSVRFGWMLTDPADAWWGRGNYEWLCDTVGAAIISDYGHWFAGQVYYLRYNFVEPGSPIVPYSQIGLGWVLNDAYRDQTQRAVGALFEFYLHYEVGVKCFLAPNLSLDLEGGIQHISNADTASRNKGVNAFGGSIGFTYYFPAASQ
ncbi:MAG: acyloxyacyl hydrolase [Zavarzinella sp.]|nr:acyloxyacyl hydrolase [Zavarzinella sp.]